MKSQVFKRTPSEWAQRLVDNVSTVTQLDPEKDELPNVDDWRRCAEQLFDFAIAQGRAEALEEK